MGHVTNLTHVVGKGEKITWNGGQGKKTFGVTGLDGLVARVLDVDLSH